MIEYFRKAIRNVLGYDSRLYRFGASSLDFYQTVWTNSFRTWRLLASLGSQNGINTAPTPVMLRNLRHPMYLRPGTDDAGTVICNVIREEYGRLVNLDSPVWMIDAGAYIADTSAYFLSRFPDLNVIALEPHPENYAMSQLNLEPYGNRAMVLRRGLSATEGIERFSGEGTGASIASTGMEIDCTTIPALLTQYGISRIDILKMDIEGAEEAIFSTNPEEWLEKVGLLIIEIHGERARSLIAQVLRKNGFSMENYRSVWYCRPVGGSRTL